MHKFILENCLPLPPGALLEDVCVFLPLAAQAGYQYKTGFAAGTFTLHGCCKT